MGILRERVISNLPAMINSQGPSSDSLISVVLSLYQKVSVFLKFLHEWVNLLLFKESTEIVKIIYAVRSQDSGHY